MKKAFAKGSDSLGVNWGVVLTIPETNAEQFPEVKKLIDLSLQSIQCTFSAETRARRQNCTGVHPGPHGGTELTTAVMPAGFPIFIAPERREAFAAGLDNELLAVIQATAEAEITANGAVTKRGWLASMTSPPAAGGVCGLHGDRIDVPRSATDPRPYRHRSLKRNYGPPRQCSMRWWSGVKP